MKHLAKFLATGAYVGYLPKMPGTFGTLEGALIVVVLHEKGLGIYLSILIIAVILGIKSSEMAEEVYGVTDDRRIVIDEIAGFLLTMLFHQVNLKTIVLGIILFRVFDVWKPIPRLEKLPRGYGVMADDLLAGFLANLALRAITRFL